MVERCIVIAVFLTVFLFASIGRAEIYKCKTENGIVYSETKCADDSSMELNLSKTNFYKKDEGKLLIEKSFEETVDFSKKNTHIFNVPFKKLSKINGVKIAFSEIPDYRVTIVVYESVKGVKGRVLNTKRYSNFLLDSCESKPEQPCNIADLKGRPIEPVFLSATGAADGVHIVVKGYKLPSSSMQFMKVSSVAIFGDESDATAVLLIPELLTPEDGAQFNHFPRTTVLRWGSVSNATSYSVEIEYCSSSGVRNCNLSRFEDNINGTKYEFDFVGAQWGRWRVYAVDENQLSSEPSKWSTFRYNR